MFKLIDLVGLSGFLTYCKSLFVSKEAGKGLSECNYTASDQETVKNCEVYKVSRLNFSGYNIVLGSREEALELAMSDAIIVSGRGEPLDGVYKKTNLPREALEYAGIIGGEDELFGIYARNATVAKDSADVLAAYGCFCGIAESSGEIEIFCDEW